jgi:hypothetical protein
VASHVRPAKHGEASPVGVHDAPAAARAAQVPATHGSEFAHSMSDAHAAPTATLAVQTCDEGEQKKSVEAHRRSDEHAAPAVP